jgi:hypothetical protein
MHNKAVWAASHSRSCDTDHPCIKRAGRGISVGRGISARRGLSDGGLSGRRLASGGLSDRGPARRADVTDVANVALAVLPGGLRARIIRTPGRAVPRLRSGARVTAEEDVEVGTGAQLVHGAVQPGGLQSFGLAGDHLVGSQSPIRGQVKPAQRGSSGVFTPQLYPGVFLGLLPPLPRCVRVDFQHGPPDDGPDLARILARHIGQSQGLGGGRPGVVQDPGGLGDDLGLEGIDDALAERPSSAGSRVARS